MMHVCTVGALGIETMRDISPSMTELVWMEGTLKHLAYAVHLELQRDNGKEHGNYYSNGLYRDYGVEIGFRV